MENKINIAELLKDCPRGMELYSPLCGECILYDVNDYNIRISTPNKDTLICLYHDGRYCSNGEIMLFPKGKTTWEGFHRPFRDGDVVTWKDRGLLVAFIYKERKSVALVKQHIALYTGSLGIVIDGEISLVENEIVFATEEEKAKLFQAIKDNGYKWNEETKTLEKLVELKFKVGDRIRKKDNNSMVYTINGVYSSMYGVEERDFGISIEEQDEYELVPNKFDITTLKVFDKVLVRDSNKGMWSASIFSHTWENKYICIGIWYNQCIPYEGNEHLLGITNDCDDFYKTWK